MFSNLSNKIVRYFYENKHKHKMSYTFRISSLSILQLLTIISISYSQNTAVQSGGTGLEVDEDIGVEILIDDLTEYGKNIGLSEDQIRQEASYKMEKSGIKISQTNYPPYVFLDIRVYKSAFTIEISLSRTILYKTKSGKRYSKLGVTWSQSLVGIHDGTSGYIMDKLSRILDIFISKYKDANT